MGKVRFRKKFRKPLKEGFKVKEALFISELVKSCNPFEKLRLLRDDKFPMGVLEKKTIREGFCEHCRLPGHIYKQRRMSLIKNVCCVREGMVLHLVILKQNKYHEYHEGLFPR